MKIQSCLLLAVMALAAGAGLFTAGLTTSSEVPAVIQGDYRVVFFGAEGASSGNGLVNASTLAETFGAVSASTWEEVMALNDAERIDALIIHRSVLEQVDSAWVAENYRQGVVMAGLDINGVDMAELLQDACLTRDGFANYSSGSYFILASSQIDGASPDAARVLESYRQSCGGQAAEGVVGTTSYMARRTTEYLTDERSVAIFEYVLSDHMADYAD